MALKRHDYIGLVLLGGLLVLLNWHAASVCLEFVAAIRYPFELAYGEGIVWQQAALIPGPRMYSTSTTLPFIAFHYPPLFHLFSRAALTIMPSFLAAGRLVSSLATLLIAISVTGIVMIASKRPAEARRGAEFAIAVAAGLLVLNLHAVRSWGMLMRVDMVAVALGMTGMLIGSWSSGRFWGTLCALLLCGAAVFAKQTEMPTGIAVFLIALLRNPRGALGAAAIVGSICLGALAFLQVLTSGGFLFNIIGYNLNPLSLNQARLVLRSEHSSGLVMVLVLVAALFVCRSVLPTIFRGQLRTALHEVREIRTASEPIVCRALLLLDFGLTTLMLFQIFKYGSSYNYLLDWLIIGCALIGVMLVDLFRGGVRRAFPAPILALTLAVAVQPLRQMQNVAAADSVAWQEAVVQRIASAKKPVASEDMTLLMLGGQQVFFEPAIVTALATAGMWDETPLVQMIGSGNFAFMLTEGNHVGGSYIRTSAVDSAMRAAYPKVEEVGPGVWLHLPAGNRTD
jgi:hypothetical protein